MSITVDTRFPGGNGADIEIIEDAKCPTVAFAADPHGGPEALWFNLRISITPPVQQLTLVLKHFRNSLGGRHNALDGLRPVIRSSGSDWTRLPAGSLKEYPDGRADIAWEIAQPGSTVDVAFCYPYGEPELDALVKETGLTADIIGLSQGGRQIVRLSNRYGSVDASTRHPGLYLMCRQHASETPGAWTLDGFLRAIAAAGDRAPLVWCVPISNIDGVVQGDYGKDNFPYDLNRAWGQPDRKSVV